MSAMAFGAMILASSPVLVSCSDYDDDIDRLQNQVDGIKGENPVTPAELQAALDAAKADYQAALELALTGKADNAAVQALQAKVNELNDALNGKADAATVEGILNDIRTLSEEVNSVKGGLDGVKSELQGEIDALKEKIAGVESGAATKAELKSQLDAAVAELNAKIAAADNTADIEALNGKLTELKNAQDALSGKLDADKTELTGKIADALAKAEAAAAKAGDAATKAEVEALKSTVDALKGTVASNEALNGIKSELEGKIAEAMAKAQEAAAAAGNAASAAAFEELKGTVATLSGKIDELTNKPSLTEADVRSLIQAELTSSLTDLNNKMVQVENSIGNNARAITELTQKIAKIAEIESTLTDYESRLALVESGKASKQDLSDLATRVGTLETSMQGLSETIGSYLTANSYAKLSDIDSKLSTQLAGYYTKGEVDQAIQNKIDAAKQLTEAQQKAVQEVFANLDTEAEGFKTYAELLGEVADLNAKFAEDGDVAALETGLSDLDKKFNEFVNSANAAIQSIVFMPEYTDRMVTFNSLVLAASNKNLAITSTNERTIRFRVTPAAAAKNLVENYDLKFLAYEMKIRGIGGNEYIEQVGPDEDIDVSKDGVVSIRVTTGEKNKKLEDSKYYSICLQATAKDKKDDEGKVIDGVMKADLTSDYFTLGVVLRKVTQVFVKQNTQSGLSIDYNKPWSFDYKSGRTFIDQNSEELSDEFNMEKVGKVTYDVDNKKEFSIDSESGILTYTKANDVSSIDKTAKVTATYTFNADKVNTTNFQTSYDNVTIVKVIDNVSFDRVNFGKVDWTQAKTIPLDMTAIQNATGLETSDFKTMTEVGKETFKLNGTNIEVGIMGNLTNGLFITVPRYINMANVTYTTTIPDENGKMTTKNALRLKYRINELKTFEIIVNMPTVSEFPEVKIERNTSWWVDDNIRISAVNEPDNGKIESVKLTEMDYSEVFNNYKNDKVEYFAKGLSYEVKVNPVLGVKDENQKINIDKETYRGDAIGINAVVRLNKNNQSAVLKSDKGSFVVPDLSGDWKVEKLTFEKDGQLTGSINLAEGCTWTSRDGYVMWKNGQLYWDGNTNKAIADAAMFKYNPMGIYGLEAPKFEVVSGTDPDNLVSVNSSTGMLTFTSKAANFVLAKDYVIKVKVMVKSQWGKYANWKNNVNEGVTKEITLTLKKQ